MAFSVPELPYEYTALEPYIDEQTMRLHHDKHHAAYVQKLNTALEDTEWLDKDIVEVLTSLDQLPADKQKAVRNNGGGHYNHSLFWKMMGAAGTEMPESLKAKIEADFGSVDAFKEQFTTAAVNQFGSGWAWLVSKEGKLSVTSTPNQDNPIMEDPNCTVVLGLDVWEHAYYLKYQNKRPDYINAFWHVVNWEHVASLCEA
jgi:superoxide dismutase, Fe-Mn family